MIDATETRRRTDTPQDPTGSPEGGRPDLRWLVDRLIAAIDRALSEQVNAILHHPEFQRLEASWRSVKYLADAAHGIDQTRVRVLSVSWRELARDLTRAAEYDQSQMFDKIYNQEFGMPGGEPFGLLIGDYEISPLPAIRRPASAERAVSTDRRADGNPVVGDLLRTLTPARRPANPTPSPCCGKWPRSPPRPLRRSSAMPHPPCSGSIISRTLAPRSILPGRFDRPSTSVGGSSSKTPPPTRICGSSA
jgi:hypothetical protein